MARRRRPASDALKGQLLGLLGIALTAVVAFSSTTFVANAMAGLMLRAVGNFRPGDWVHVGEQLGRVTERRFFHTEIQTEDRDLVTLPNLYLVTNPVKVVRSSGTIVATRLLLGYDHHHAAIEALLVEAAQASGLEEAFVQILELGDFSVSYRVAGFLSEVKQLLSIRSRLQASVLDTLHGAGVEFVSPTFMNQRPLTEGVRFVPPDHLPAPRGPESPPPEEIIFDKADQQATLEELRTEREKLLAEIGELERGAGSASKGERTRIGGEIERRRARIEVIAARLEQAEAQRGEAE